MAINKLLNTLCADKRVPSNEFISIDEAIYRQKNRIDPNNPVAGFIVNLDDLRHYVTQIDAYNLQATTKIEGIRIWKGIQKIDGVCLEDLLFEPIDGDTNDIHFDQDEPKANNGKPLILATLRPCPHLCGDDATKFIIARTPDTQNDQYSDCTKSNCNPYE